MRKQSEENNKKIRSIMEKGTLSLVMDTIGILCMFFIAGVLLCV